MLQIAKRWPSLSSNPAILIAQYGELKKQIPLLYALLIINASAVAYSNYQYVAPWFSVGVAGVLVAICMWRLIVWTFFAEPTSEISPERARASLTRTTIAVVPISAAYLSYALFIDQYGGPFERAGIAVCIALTVVGCIFCLIHLPQAAMLVQLTVMLPFVVYYLYRGNSIFIAVAFNVLLITSLMIRVLLNSYAGFAKMILSQTDLAVQQAAAHRLSEENSRLALTDVLTDLPNRRFFFAHLESVLNSHTASGERFAVGLLDLDCFKPINDAYGHAVGDRLLAAIGARLSRISTADLIVARLGGDEFGLLMSGNVDGAVTDGQTICDLLSEPFEFDDHRVSVGCSLGLAIFPEAGVTESALIDRADYALYKVKAAQTGGCAVFSADHATHYQSERALETTLQTADLSKELYVEFQPIVCTRTMSVLGVEALGRWASPVIGKVEPERFILTAERIGIMSAVTIKLFRMALEMFANVAAPIGLSFNLSAHDIVSPGTIRLLVEAIDQSGTDPRRITFEITETALMRDFDAAVIGINTLRKLGIAIALDDFGMGFSSLSYIHRLPLDKVKVDRSFVTDMGEDSGRKIIAAVIGLCITLELECIIEGVETDAQLQQLQELGHCVVQGYLFARPMALPALLSWLKTFGSPPKVPMWVPALPPSCPVRHARHRMGVAPTGLN